MRGKMLEEEQPWEEERIAAMCMGVGMSTGMDMRVGEVEARMRHCQEEDRVMAMQGRIGVDDVDAMM